MLKNIKLRAKILLILLFISIAAAGLVGVISLTIGTNTMKDESFKKLTAIREMKANQIENYFQQIFDQVLSLSESRTVIEATLEFKNGFDNLQSELDYSRQELSMIDTSLFLYYQTQFIEQLLNRDSSINYFSIPKNELKQSQKNWLNAASENTFPRLNPSDFQGKIHISGSSTVSSLARQIIAMYTNEGAQGEINYTVTGSSEGLINLMEDPETGLVGTSHRLTSDEINEFKKNGLKPLTFRIGTDAIIVVVSEKNVFVKNLSMTELGQVFTTASKWSDINPEWPDQNIMRFIPDEGSGSFNLFSKVVLGGEYQQLSQIPNTSTIVDGTIMKQTMSKDPYAVAFFSYNYFDRSAHQRIVQIDGTELSNTSIRNKLYPLTRPLYLVSTEEKLRKSPQISQFVNYFLNTIDSKVGTNLEADEYWPEHTNHRILQHQYLVNNPYLEGDEYQLASAKEKCSYNTTHQLYHPIFKNYLDRFGYYDIFLITADSGHIIYSVSKEVDYATDIMHGPFNNTGIAEVFTRIMKDPDRDCIYLEDFSPYLPSFNDPASFIGSAIYNGDEKIGVLVFQLPIDRINHIMTDAYEWEKVGLGKSGETYLVGDDFLLRNQSRFLIDDSENYFLALSNAGLSNDIVSKIKSLNSTIGLQPVETVGTRAALQGETGTRIFQDYRGIEVLSSYKPLKVDQVNWVIMSEIDKAEAFSSISVMVKRFLTWFTALLLMVIVLSIIFARSISKPVKTLTLQASNLAKGNLDDSIHIAQSDEIGILADNFEKMRLSLKILVTDLNELNQSLEQKVIARTRKIEEQRINITDSIHYASRIQRALLTPHEELHKLLPSYFILNKPKDIVSGDYYWVSNTDNGVIVAVADCTGHGVPGAFMSILGISFLNEIVSKSEIIVANEVLNELREYLIKTLHQSGEKGEANDGMEVALCVVNFDSKKLQYAGAFRPLYLIRDKELNEIKGDSMPIGLYSDENTSFQNQEFQFKENDIIYMFSDGYVDQLGGPNRKTFRSKNFKQLLLNIHQKPLEEQEAILEKEYEEWKRDMEQIDDIMVMGIRFTKVSL
jgi:ABC-type phosphate transport system substrate-binding protein/serine phosphatase RsbU (regulator of sigma subunit)